jgi:hypothetical protein
MSAGASQLTTYNLLQHDTDSTIRLYMVIAADTGIAGGVCVICTQQAQGVIAVWRRVVDATADAVGI